MDKQAIIRSAGLVGAFVLLSRVFGLVRDMAMAALFGSSPAMDAFVVAFTIPNLFRGLFGEGALSSAFVPVFTETLQTRGRPEAWRFAASLAAFLAAGLAALVGGGILLAGLARGLLPLSPRIGLILELLQIMLPYTLFICLAAFFSAMLNSLRRFVLPAATPVAMNLIMIAALLAVCPLLPADGNGRILAVAWSVIAAGAVQGVMQLPPLLRAGFRPRLSADWHDPRLRRVWALMGAAIIGVGGTQVQVLLGRGMAVWIGAGSASYLYYAERLIYLPLGIFATALGTILLPAFSVFAARERPDLMLDTLAHSLRQLLFIMLPAAAGLLALAAPIVGLVYERGDFTALAAAQTARVVQCYAPGLVLFSLLKVLVPVFYARQDMATPVRIGLACTGLNVLLMLALMGPLKHAGLALASVLAAGAQAAILALAIHRRVGSPGWPRLLAAAARMALAALIMALAARGLFAWAQLAGWPDALPPPLARHAPLALALLAAPPIYATAAALLGCGELRDLWAAFRRRAGSRASG